MREPRDTFSAYWHRRAIRLLYVVLGLAMVFVLIPISGGSPQASGQSASQAASMRAEYPDPYSTIDPTSPEGVEAERRLNALNMERRKQMISDTDKLLQLARQLNDEMAKNSGTLSPDQLQKVAEIEKLARGVKDKMANGAGQPAIAEPEPLHNHRH